LREAQPAGREIFSWDSFCRKQKMAKMQNGKITLSRTYFTILPFCHLTFAGFSFI
jgi:hypothetical protein